MKGSENETKKNFARRKINVYELIKLGRLLLLSVLPSKMTRKDRKFAQGEAAYRDDAKQFGSPCITENTTTITVRSFLLVSIDLTFFHKWWIKPGTRTSTDSKKSARNQRGLTVV